jgi:hypothetical protein
MTKPKTTTPAEAPSVHDAERQVAQRNDELVSIRTEIATREASLVALALVENDTAFEEASLAVDRLRRHVFGATTRLEAARETLTLAKAREEHCRRHGIYEAGRKAAAEAERLAGIYAEHANAIAETLVAIDRLREPIAAANADLPDDEREIDAHALEIHKRVELPAAGESGEPFWYREDHIGYSPLNPRPVPEAYIPQPVFANGRWIFSGDDEYEAAVAAEKSKPTFMPSSAKPLPSQPQYGERQQPDGSRKISVPPVAWPPVNDTTGIAQ